MIMLFVQLDLTGTRIMGGYGLIWCHILQDAAHRHIHLDSLTLKAVHVRSVPLTFILTLFSRFNLKVMFC